MSWLWKRLFVPIFCVKINGLKSKWLSIQNCSDVYVTHRGTFFINTHVVYSSWNHLQGMAGITAWHYIQYSLVLWINWSFCRNEWIVPQLYSPKGRQLRHCDEFGMAGNRKQVWGTMMKTKDFMKLQDQICDPSKQSCRKLRKSARGSPHDDHDDGETWDVMTTWRLVT